MTTNTCVMTAGMRLHGLALARPTAMAASPAAVPRASRVSTTPAASWWDFPSAVEMAPKTAATPRPRASIS